MEGFGDAVVDEHVPAARVARRVRAAERVGGGPAGLEQLALARPARRRQRGCWVGRTRGRATVPLVLIDAVKAAEGDPRPKHFVKKYPRRSRATDLHAALARRAVAPMGSWPPRQRGASGAACSSTWPEEGGRSRARTPRPRHMRWCRGYGRPKCRGLLLPRRAATRRAGACGTSRQAAASDAQDGAGAAARPRPDRPRRGRRRRTSRSPRRDGWAAVAAGRRGCRGAPTTPCATRDRLQRQCG